MFTARESRGLDVARLPDEVAVSVIIDAELRAGVLAASDLSGRSRRLTTLQTVADLDALPIDAPVADAWAELRLRIAESGRRISIDDTWIAATALAHDVPVVSQDADFDVLADLGGLRVTHV